MMRGNRKYAAAAALLFCLLWALTALSEEPVFDAEDGVWSSGGGAGTVSDKEGFVSGYMTILRGHVVYRDANRTDPLGFATEESVVYAARARVYEKGAVYQVRFDTAQTADEEKCVTGYYYTQEARIADAEEATLGGRILDGVAIPIIRFHYGAETGAESQYNVVTASGTAYIARGGTNLREGPGASYNYVARLAKDTKVTITGFNINSNVTWYYVYDGEGNRGFVRADLLTDLPSTVIPTPEPSQPASAENPEDTEETEDPEDAEDAENPEAAEDTEDPEAAEDAENPEAAEAAEDAEDAENPEAAEAAEDAEDAEDTEAAEAAEDAEDAEDAEGTEEPEAAEDPADGTEAAPDGAEEGEEPESTPRSVRVTLTWEKTGTEPAFGDRAYLTAQLTGYEGVPYTLQWQESRDGERWTDVAGATMPSLILTMTEENYRNFWRVLVTAEAPEQPAAAEGAADPAP